MSHCLSFVPPVSHHPLNDLFHSVTTVTSLLFTSVHITLGNLEFVLTFHNKVTVNNHFQQSQYSIFLTLHSTKFCHSVGVISGYISMSKETGHTRQRLRSYLMSSCGVLPDVQRLLSFTVTIKINFTSNHAIVVLILIIHFGCYHSRYQCT